MRKLSIALIVDVPAAAILLMLLGATASARDLTMPENDAYQTCMQYRQAARIAMSYKELFAKSTNADWIYVMTRDAPPLVQDLLEDAKTTNETTEAFEIRATKACYITLNMPDLIDNQEWKQEPGPQKHWYIVRTPGLIPYWNYR